MLAIWTAQLTSMCFDRAVLQCTKYRWIGWSVRLPSFSR